MRDTRPSTTAEIVAFMRATEQRKSLRERVVDDRLAESFLGPAFRALLSATKLTGRWPDRLLLGLTNFTVSRHRFIDDRLVAVLQAPPAHRAEQVVVVGAGYDTRAQRLAKVLGERPVFEVDHPATAARKAKILADDLGHGTKPNQRSAPVRRVVADLMREPLSQSMTRAGFDPKARSFFVVEGLIMYLSRSALAELLTELQTLAAPGSVLSLDCWYPHDGPGIVGDLHRAAAALLFPVFGEPLTFSAQPDAMEGLLAMYGFTVESIAEAEDLRLAHLAPSAPLYPTCYVLSASRNEDSPTAPAKAP